MRLRLSLALSLKDKEAEWEKEELDRNRLSERDVGPHGSNHSEIILA